MKGQKEEEKKKCNPGKGDELHEGEIDKKEQGRFRELLLVQCGWCTESEVGGKETEQSEVGQVSCGHICKSPGCQVKDFRLDFIIKSQRDIEGFKSELYNHICVLDFKTILDATRRRDWSGAAS